MKIGEWEVTAAEIEVYLEYFRVYQKYAYALLVCIVSVQLLFLWVAPRLSDYREKTLVLTKYRRILKENQKKVLDKENVERELNRLKRLVGEKQTIFFTENDFSEFAINILPRIADGYGARIKSIKYYDVTESPKARLFPLTLDMSTDFIGLINFFSELETFPKIVKIKRFAISRESSKPVRLNVKMSLDAYGLKK
ncbi:MAG: hypothetical protein ACI9BD_000454 [Candidatus Marinamargulisbacteria bacterium]